MVLFKKICPIHHYQIKNNEVIYVCQSWPSKKLHPFNPWKTLNHDLVNVIVDRVANRVVSREFPWFLAAGFPGKLNPFPGIPGLLIKCQNFRTKEKIPGISRGIPGNSRFFERFPGFPGNEKNPGKLTTLSCTSNTSDSVGLKIHGGTETAPATPGI